MAKDLREYRRRDVWETDRGRQSHQYDTPNHRNRIALRAKPQESSNPSYYNDSMYDQRHADSYYQNQSRSYINDPRDSRRHSTMDASQKYKHALEERPTAATYSRPTTQVAPQSTKSRRSEASYTLRGDGKASSHKKTSHRSALEVKPSKSGRSQQPAQICTIVHCQHTCQKCCSNCRGTQQSNSPMMTLSIHQPPIICKCGRSEKASKEQSIVNSTRSQIEKNMSRTGSFGGGKQVQQLASPPSRKSSMASQQSIQSQANQKQKDPLYNLIYSQNNMIRQITTELSKQREITKEVETDLKAWRHSREKSEAMAEQNKPMSLLREENQMQRSFQGREESQRHSIVSKHSKSYQTLNVIETSPNNFSHAEEEFSNRAGNQSQNRIKSNISKKSGIPVSDFERQYLMEKGKPRCSSLDNHQRKAKLKVYRNPLVGSNENIKRQSGEYEKHHQRCCLNGLKGKKPVQQKPQKTSKESLKIATPHLYQLSYCGSACKPLTLPFTSMSAKKRLGLTARRPRDPRPMNVANRQPAAVIDALADVIARRLKVELRP